MINKPDESNNLKTDPNFEDSRLPSAETNIGHETSSKIFLLYVIVFTVTEFHYLVIIRITNFLSLNILYDASILNTDV